MNIAIYTRNIANVYSGGRFYTMYLAMAASSKHNVFYISNVKPLFSRDFECYESYKNINFVINKDFRLTKSIKIDLVFIIPDLSLEIEWFYKFYLVAINRAYKDRAKLLLLNFETPNWVNSVSEIKKDTSLWNFWLETAKYSDAILSSVKLGTEYAKKYFQMNHLHYYYCYPAINQAVADLYKNKIDKNNEIIVFARFFDKSKGSYSLEDFLTPKLSGYIIKIIVGHGEVPENFKKNIEEKAKKYNIKIIYLHKITDEEKFVEIASSKFLLFLSNFEGFGSPPVEALYMKTHVIAKYLDVLYEVSENNIEYINTIDDFNQIDINKLLSKNIKHNKNIEIKNYIDNLNNIFESIIIQKNIHSKKYTSLMFLNLVTLYKINYSRMVLKLEITKKYFYTKLKFNKKYEHIASTKNVYIYGIGEYSKVWTKWCQENDKNILGYIVTEKTNIEEIFLNKPIIEPNEIVDINALIILSTINGVSGFSMMDNLPKLIKEKNILFSPNNQTYDYWDLEINKITQDSLEFIYTKNKQ